MKMESQTIAIVVATVFAPVIPTVISIFFFLKNRKYESRKLIEERLFRIQQIAFEYPYVEDDNFISGWNQFVDEYRKGANIEEKRLWKYLQYEQYCEMIFNLLELALNFYKKEEELLQLIDFKSWIREHKEWWKNPLDEHSNYDTYDERVIQLVDKWIK